MIDAILYIALGVVGTLLFNHFKGESPQKATSEIFNLEQKVQAMITDAMTQALASVKTAAEQAATAAVDAYKAANPPADPQAAVDAAQAEDAAAVQALAAEIHPAG